MGEHPGAGVGVGWRDRGYTECFLTSHEPTPVQLTESESDRSPHTFEALRANFLWEGADAGMGGIGHTAARGYKANFRPSLVKQGGKKMQRQGDHGKAWSRLRNLI